GALTRHAYFYYSLFTGPAATEFYTLSLHDALPILLVAVRDVHDHADRGPNAQSPPRRRAQRIHHVRAHQRTRDAREPRPRGAATDRKSTRLNSSHVEISYAVFCLKKKNKNKQSHNI